MKKKPKNHTVQKTPLEDQVIISIEFIEIENGVITLRAGSVSITRSRLLNSKTTFSDMYHKAKAQTP